MKDAEEKILKAQVVLFQEILDIDDMIINTIQNTSRRVFNDVIKDKMFFNEGQETVVLTADEFNQIRVVLARLSENDGLKQLDSYINQSYFKPKEEKLKILRMLK